MKTKINQIVTVVSFFASAMTLILLISWGMASLVFANNKNDKSVNSSLSQNVKAEIKIEFIESFKYLIPKIK